MEKLKILLVANGVMTNQLGVLKVHYELKEEYERQGHIVDILDFSVIYSNGINAFTKLFGHLYTYKFWQFLKINAYKYDVIDANIECITYPKESYGFKGVLVARSHGMRPVYLLAENIKSYSNELRKERSNITFKTRIGNVYRSLQKQVGLKEFYASIKYADLVHCLNQAEYDFLLNYGLPKDKLLLIPNGLLDSLVHKYNAISNKNKVNSLCFIGAWTIRKGVKDLNRIISAVRSATNIEYLYLLGGHYPENYIRNDFSENNQTILKIYPNFEPLEIPNYVNTCKVGIFPSYLEGFSLAIIEQLACGIPVVAYKIPGLIDILTALDETLLIEPGNTAAFAKKVDEILQLDKVQHTELSEKCKQESKKYLLSNISKSFLDAYKKGLNKETLISD